MLRFENLNAWQLHFEYSDDIDRVMRFFPADERLT